MVTEQIALKIRGHLGCDSCITQSRHSAEPIGDRPPDACFGGMLPGVKFACCGHGSENGGYIVFDNGVVVRGVFSSICHEKDPRYNTCMIDGEYINFPNKD